MEPRLKITAVTKMML